MSAALLGILLGVANVFANGALFAVFGRKPHDAGLLVTCGMLPGVVAGALIGLLAGATSRSTRIERFVVLVVPAVFVVVGLGALFELAPFVPFATVPTVLACMILESRTRSRGVDANGDSDLVVAPRPHRSAVTPAMLLGAIVMLIVMAGALNADPHQHWVAVYVPWGMGCGAGLAAPFGVLADATRGKPVWLRRAQLLTGALIVTFALGSFVRMEWLIPLSLIPTAAGCLLLERYSRAAPLVPVATVRV